MKLDDPEGQGLEYIEFFHLAVALRDSVERALFIGLGGATGPRQFAQRYPEMKIDVVEIDAEVIRVAQELFGFETSARCRVHEADGLTFLETARRKWDVIVVDAYTTRRGKLAVPGELMTPEFFDLCSQRLTRDGLLVFNCADAAESRLGRGVHTALGEVFPAILTFESTTAENAVMLASNEPLELRSTKLAEIVRRAGRSALAKRCRQLYRPMSR